MFCNNSVFRFQHFHHLRKIFYRNRKLSRKPIRVLTNDGEDYERAFSPKLDPIIEPKLNQTFAKSRKRGAAGKDEQSSQSPEFDFSDERRPKPRLDGIPVYDKLGENNNEFIKIMTELKSRSKREKLKLLALEGKRLISDGLDAGLKLKTLYFSIEENLVGIKNLSQLPDKGVKLKKVFYKDLKLFSDHVTSPGVVGIFERPSTAGICEVHSQRSFDLPVTLIADNVRDPGNLGTIIRTAAAAGIEKVLCVKGCVDTWETKVVRSSCGAHFRIPVIHDLEWPFIFNYIPTNAVKVYVADSTDFSENGVQESSISHDMEIITTANTESVVVDENTGKTMKCDESFESESILEKYRKAVIKTEYYSNVNYTSESDHVVIVIGGEACGPSLQSLKLCHDVGGCKLKIPLECGVDSLNTSIAASIILYEIKRQFNAHAKSK